MGLVYFFLFLGNLVVFAKTIEWFIREDGSDGIEQTKFNKNIIVGIMIMYWFFTVLFLKLMLKN